MKDNTNNNNISGFLLGLLAGGVIGGTIALLYAPKSGRELRRDINSQKDRLLDEAGEYIESAKTTATNILHETKKKADTILTDAKRKGQEIIEGAGKIYENGKGKVLNETGKVKDAINAGVEAYRDERTNANQQNSKI